MVYRTGIWRVDCGQKVSLPRLEFVKLLTEWFGFCFVFLCFFLSP